MLALASWSTIFADSIDYKETTEPLFPGSSTNPLFYLVADSGIPQQGNLSFLENSIFNIPGLNSFVSTDEGFSSQIDKLLDCRGGGEADLVDPSGCLFLEELVFPAADIPVLNIPEEETEDGPWLSTRLYRPDNRQFPYFIDFRELAKLQLGESIWSNLRVGSGNLNDFVIRNHFDDPFGIGVNISITAKKNDQRGFVYLDSQSAGLGVCESIVLDNESDYDKSYPGSEVNRCVNATDIDLSEYEVIEFRPSQDIWIREIGFLSPLQHCESAACSAAVAAGNPVRNNLIGSRVLIDDKFHTFDIEQDDDEVFYWRPAMPYFIAANDSLKIARHNTNIVVASMQLVQARQVSNLVPVPRARTQQALEQCVVNCNGVASVPEPPAVLLLSMGLIGMLGFGSRRKILLGRCARARYKR
jgi:hypothetical protein